MELGCEDERLDDSNVWFFFFSFSFAGADDLLNMLLSFGLVGKISSFILRSRASTVRIQNEICVIQYLY